jgi:hypothetical protein
MKKTLFLFISLTFCIVTFGQDKFAKKTSVIVEEGRKLYKSEMASWYGTDIFLEKYIDHKENIGGYFSYTENDTSICVFFAKGNIPSVIGTMSFDSTYNILTARTDLTERTFTSKELELYIIRKKALEAINDDTLFKTFNNTNLNLIPIIDKEGKRVYVLTGPQKNGVVIFGNDYLLTFDKNNLVKKRCLHKNIIPIEYSKDEEDVITFHTHLSSSGNFITATDICTLLLYEKFAKWKQHIVMSKKYVSIWDCKTERLLVLTKKVWDKIYKDQEKRHPNQN